MNYYDPQNTGGHSDAGNTPGGYPSPSQETGNPAGQQTGHPTGYGAGHQSGYPSSGAYSSGPYDNNSWNYTNTPYYQHQSPYTGQSHYGGYTQPPAPQKPKKKGRGVKVASLLLACALFGFGGGYAAVNLATQADSQTVVYKSADHADQAQGVSEAEDGTVAGIAAKAGESVVSITTENLVADYFTGGRVVSGAGSGVIISEDGTIITNNHVVEGAQNVLVTLPDGSDHQATVLGRDPYSDIAVLKINVTGLTPAVFANSDDMQVGDFCLAIGNPLGTLGGTVTNGIISAKDREITIDGVSMSLMQMSAAVSPGNSGGGLFNDKGELIGIVNAKTGGSEAENLGFAIPSNTAMDVAQQLIENGSVPGRPGLGVTVVELSEQEAAQNGLPAGGVYLMSVNEGGGAHQAGLQQGDRILSIDGKTIATTSDISDAIAEKNIGDTVTVEYQRDTQTASVNVTLQELLGN